MKGEIRHYTPCPRDGLSESFLPVSCTTFQMNYHTFSGFGCVRRGFNNPYRFHDLDRECYPYPLHNLLLQLPILL